MPAARYFGTVFLFRQRRISSRLKFVAMRIRGLAPIPPKRKSRHHARPKVNHKVKRRPQVKGEAVNSILTGGTIFFSMR